MFEKKFDKPLAGVAVFDFAPSERDELRLTEGDQVVVCLCVCVCVCVCVYEYIHIYICIYITYFFFNFTFKDVLYELSNDIKNSAFQLFPRHLSYFF